MNKLLKKVQINNSKDDAVKQTIINQLSNVVKELQYSGVNKNEFTLEEDTTEAVNQLCVIIEALFLHGLKDSLSQRFRMALADVDARPEPNFWAPLLIISHRQIIDQISTLKLITTDVGQCRAWVRIAVNDCLLSSYLSTLKQDSSSLKSYYKVSALVRDSENLDVVQRLIEGFEAVNTTILPLNSSLLNTWPPSSLYLAGIWAPTLKVLAPVAPCDDVAQSLDIQASKSLKTDYGSDSGSLSSAVSLGSLNSFIKPYTPLNEEEVLKLILSKDKDKNISPNQSSEDLKSSSEYISKSEQSIDQLQFSIGNSLNNAKGWSFDEHAQNEVINEKPIEEPTSSKQNVDRAVSMEGSFNALIQSYNMLDGDYIRTPNLKDVWQEIEQTYRTIDSSEENSPKRGKASQISTPSPKRESLCLAAQLGQIAREKGLDNQDFMCIECKKELNPNEKINVCAFSGKYYCDNCISPDPIEIPARIIHNWDFEKYFVSKKSHNYLIEVKDHPVIDFKLLNPLIYEVVEKMTVLRLLRIQLNYLRAYLFTCREPIIEELQKMMFPREYMYEHIHQYSLNDLMEVADDILAETLKKVVEFGKNHVFNCWLCSQKGFVCEICNKPKPLFPFDVENVYRCDKCSAVYHKGCLNSCKPCPKCERLKKREDIPIMGEMD